MKTRLIICIICLFSFKQILFAQIIQDFKFAKKINSLKTSARYPYLKVVKNRLIQFIPYDSAVVYDATTKVADNPSSTYSGVYIAVIDTMGNLKSSVDCKGFKFANGTPIPFANDTSFYFQNPLNKKLFIGGVKIYDSIPANGYHLAQCDLSGRVKDLQAFYVNANIYSMVANSSDKSLYVLFSNVTAFDLTKHDTTLFRIGKSSIVKIDSNGNIAHTWFVDKAFSNFNLSKNSIFLYNAITATNYTYTIDTLTYYRNDSIDRFTMDIILGSIKLSTGKYNWHDMVKASTMHGASFDSYSDDSLLLLAIQYTDTITLGGQSIGAISSGGKFVFASLDSNGKIIWKKEGFGLTVGSNSMSVTKSRNLSLKFSCYSIFNYDLANNFATSNSITNRLITDKTGNVKCFYNTAFSKDANSIMYESENDSVYYANVHLTSSLVVINGLTYTAPAAGSLGYVFYKARILSDSTNIRSGLTQLNKNDVLVKLFPNPVSKNFYIENSIPSNTNAELKIYDLSGKIISSMHQNLSDEVDVSELNNGMYLIVVKQDDKTFYSKFIKQ